MFCALLLAVVALSYDTIQKHGAGSMERETASASPDSRPALLKSSNAAMHEKLMEAASAPWSQGAVHFWSQLASYRESDSTCAGTRMRSNFLPLLQQEQLVRCLDCDRVVILEHFANHQATCGQLPRSVLAEDEGPLSTRSRMPQRPEPKLMYSRGRGIGKRDRGRHGGALRGKTVPDAGHGCNSTSVGGRRSSQKTGALDSFTELGKDPFEDVLALGSSPQATEPQPVDPLWVAEWSTMIQQLPPLKESAAAATSGDRSRWPKPLVVPKYECKRWRLWGLPTSELAKPSTNAGNSMSGRQNMDELMERYQPNTDIFPKKRGSAAVNRSVSPGNLPGCRRAF